MLRGFACIHLTLERNGLRCFVQHRIKYDRPKRTKIYVYECMRSRIPSHLLFQMQREESDMKLSNFSLVDENWYQNNFKYIPVLFTFSKSLR